MIELKIHTRSVIGSGHESEAGNLDLSFIPVQTLLLFLFYSTKSIRYYYRLKLRKLSIELSLMTRYTIYLLQHPTNESSRQPRNLRCTRSTYVNPRPEISPINPAKNERRPRSASSVINANLSAGGYGTCASLPGVL